MATSFLVRIGEPSASGSASSPTAAAAAAPAPALRAQAHEEPPHAPSVAHSECRDVSENKSNASSESTGPTSSSSDVSCTKKSHAAASKTAVLSGRELLAVKRAKQTGGECHSPTQALSECSQTEAIPNTPSSKRSEQTVLKAAATSASVTSKCASSSRSGGREVVSASASDSRGGEKAEAGDSGHRTRANDKEKTGQQQQQTRSAASGEANAIAEVPPTPTRIALLPSETLSDPRIMITTTRYRSAPFNTFDRAIIRTQLDQCLSRIVQQNHSVPHNEEYKRALKLFARFKGIKGSVTLKQINKYPTQENSIWDPEGISVLLAGWPRQDGCVFGYCINYEFDITGAYLQKPAARAADVEFFFLLDFVRLNGLILSLYFKTLYRISSLYTVITVCDSHSSIYSIKTLY